MTIGADPIALFFGSKVASAATPETGRSWFATPWADVLDIGIANAAPVVMRAQSSGFLTGGFRYTDPGSSPDHYRVWRVGLSAGTFKWAQLFRKGTNHGIHTIKIDEIGVGAIDAYNSTTTDNNFAEIVGIDVQTAGTKTVEQRSPSKNAASTEYHIVQKTIALLRTGAQAGSLVTATPGTFISDTPWAGTKTATGFLTRDQDSANLSGGRLRGSATQNDEMTRDHWLPAGTLKIAIIYRTNSDAGIFSLQFDGVTQGTVDSYAASFSNNNYSEVTGLVKATASLVVCKEIMATKNASSSGYNGNLQTRAIVRTAA